MARTNSTLFFSLFCFSVFPVIIFKCVLLGAAAAGSSSQINQSLGFAGVGAKKKNEERDLCVVT
jgi:hypothetical protein